MICVYDSMQSSLSDEYIAEATFLEGTAITRFKSVKECEEKYYMSRQITESEYTLYRQMQHIIEEIYLHDLTEGFPREEAVNMALLEMRTTVREVLRDFQKEGA